MFATRTSLTFTWKKLSTAFLISGLVASRCTSKQTACCVSRAAVDFSVISGRRMTSYKFFMVPLRRQPFLQLLQALLRDEHRLAVEDVVDRDVRRVEHLHVRVVASRQHQRVGRLVIDEES